MSRVTVMFIIRYRPEFRHPNVLFHIITVCNISDRPILLKIGAVYQISKTNRPVSIRNIFQKLYFCWCFVLVFALMRAITFIFYSLYFKIHCEHCSIQHSIQVKALKELLVSARNFTLNFTHRQLTYTKASVQLSRRTDAYATVFRPRESHFRRHQNQCKFQFNGHHIFLQK